MKDQELELQVAPMSNDTMESGRRNWGLQADNEQNYEWCKSNQCD